MSKKKITYDDKYKEVGYYRMINHLDNPLMNVVKFEEPNGKCSICGAPTEWISRTYHTPICSEVCLKKMIKNEKE